VFVNYLCSQLLHFFQTFLQGLLFGKCQLSEALWDLWPAKSLLLLLQSILTKLWVPQHWLHTSCVPPSPGFHPVFHLE